ncbi:hypothetical protein BF49_2917 [Bradyrhizobium sp.]|nr:hypothetical protein BF49_2917 [Bradyrhizobium sp.]
MSARRMKLLCVDQPNPDPVAPPSEPTAVIADVIRSSFRR